jgi:dipeptidyl aminopeptidase/acylaminoacyl peptidase
MLRLTCLACLLPFTLLGQPNGQLISTTPVVLPSYDEIRDIAFYYDEVAYTAARSDDNLIIERLVYTSDSLKVVAFLARSARAHAAARHPVIIFNRGSYIRNDIAHVHAPLFKTFVDSGFIVIAPALRGSEGGEGKDEMGGSDLHDIWNILPVLSSRADVDTANLFILGESRGAMMTLQVLRDGFPAKAAAIVGVISDMNQYVADNPGIETFARQIWPDFEENRESIARERSALQWAGEIDVPLLILAGSADKAVNPDHSIALARQLGKFNKEYQLLILNGGNHVLSGPHSDRRDAEIFGWFRESMK